MFFRLRPRTSEVAPLSKHQTPAYALPGGDPRTRGRRNVELDEFATLRALLQPGRVALGVSPVSHRNTAPTLAKTPVCAGPPARVPLRRSRYDEFLNFASRGIGMRHPWSSIRVRSVRCTR